MPEPDMPTVWFTTADVDAARQRLADNRYGGPGDLHDLDAGDIDEIIRIVLTLAWPAAYQRGLTDGRTQATEAVHGEAELLRAGYRSQSEYGIDYVQGFEAAAAWLVGPWEPAKQAEPGVGWRLARDEEIQAAAEQAEDGAR